jgi:O-antigen/teichoic acid export membrane protein
VENKRSYWLRSGFFTIAGRLSVIIFGFGSVYLLLRGLTKIDFGVWVLFLTIASFIEVGRIGLQQNALIKYLSNSKEEDYAKISSASLMLNLLITLGFILVLLLIARPLSLFWEAPELETMLYLYCITTTVLVPFIQFNAVQQANLDFRGTFWSGFTKQGLFFFYILILYLTATEIKILNLAIFQIFSAAAGAIVSWWFTRSYLKWDWKIDWHWVKELFNFGKFVFGTNISTMLYKSIDKIMLGSLLSPIPVAMYELAIRITNLAEVPTFSVASIVFPQSARTLEKEGKQGIKHLYEKSVGAILAILLPFILFVLIFPNWVITIIASTKYLDAVPILQLTMLYGLFIPFAVQCGTVLDSMGKPKVNFFFTLIGAGLNIIFNYIFISNFGLLGAAYGTLTTYLVTFIMMQIVLYKELGVKAYNVFKHILPFYQEALIMIKSYLKKQQPAKNVEEDIITLDASKTAVAPESPN